MAPNLAPSKHELIYDMIHSGELSVSQMAQAAGCSKRTILRISANIRLFGTYSPGQSPSLIEPWCMNFLGQLQTWICGCENKAQDRYNRNYDATL